ncbi:ATP-binding protein [Candidatus Omnitrophota bacterium]
MTLQINLFSLSGLCVTFTSFFLILILSSRGKSRVHLLWGVFNCILFLWGIGIFLVGRSTSEAQAIFYWKIAHLSGLFISISFYHMVSSFCLLKRNKTISFAYFYFMILVTLNFTNILFSNVNFFHEINLYYPLATNFIYPLCFLPWLVFALLGNIELVSYYRKTSGIKRNQALYLSLGSMIGFAGGTATLMPIFGINIPPMHLGNFLIPIYCIIATYAIIRYRLMDISLAVTRTGIFVIVYSLVLGTPFITAFAFRKYLILLLGQNWWIGPLAMSTFLATVGPFIYLYIQRRAEDALLREQRRYQRTLRQASSGMTRIRDLKKLLNLIVHIVTRTVRIKRCSIYLVDPKNHTFTLQAFRDKKKSPPQFEIKEDSSLIKALKKAQEPLVYEEIKQQAEDFNDSRLLTIQKQMESLNAAVVVPSLVEEDLLGFIVLGEKISGKFYSPDDLAVFAVLANQSALAIENAQFYEDIKETQTQLFQAEKMTTIGTMADGLSHQINNRFHALGMIAADTLDTIRLLNESSSPEQIREVIQQIRHALERVKENVKQGGEVVHGLLKYSRAGESGFKPINLDELIDASLGMAQYKVKLSQIDLIRDYPKDIVCIKGNFVQLQEVFFNLIDNAYDAIMQRRDEVKDPNYRGNVTIQAVATDSIIEIRFIDNGMGVKDVDQERLFTPFFTTKASSKKGTGLGLYVIQKIIVDNHKGRVNVESEFGTGTMFTIKLPAAKE